MVHIIIDDITPRIEYAVGSVATSEFIVPFPFFSDEDLVVQVDGVTQNISTYIVKGAGDSAGGSVEFDTAVTFATIVIYRDITIERVTDFPPSGPLQIDSLNTELDRQIAIDQQLHLGISDVNSEIDEVRGLLDLDIGGTLHHYSINAQVAAATIDPTVTYVQTAGYAVPGDGGAGIYRKVGFEPSHGGKIQSVDGAWWELAEPVPNVMMFGVDMTGATDSTTELTAALGYAAACTGLLTAPSGVVRLDSEVDLPHGVALRGAGMPMQPYPDASYPSGTTNGTWFFFNHTGIGFKIESVGTVFDIDPYNELVGFGTYRTQPAPTGGPYTANDHDFDIAIYSKYGMKISDIMLLNATRGILVTGIAAAERGSGRIDISRVYGHIFKVGIKLEYCYDICRISYINFGPFWCILDSNLWEYTKDNCTALTFGRCDNPHVDQVMAFAANAVLKIEWSTALHANLPGGTLNNGVFGAVQFDSGRTALRVAADVTAASMVINQFVAAGELDGTDPACFHIEGDAVDIRIAELRCVQSGVLFGRIEGIANRVRVANMGVFVSDTTASGSEQFILDADNYMHVDGYLYTDVLDDKMFGGDGIASGNVWRSYTPTARAGTGALASYTAEGSYRRVVETVEVRFEITITTNGTGAGYIAFDLPFISHSSGTAGYSVGTLRQVAGGMMGFAFVQPNATEAVLQLYNNSYPGGSGEIIAGSLTYRCAT
jgi:hypothetical protein